MTSKGALRARTGQARMHIEFGGGFGVHVNDDLDGRLVPAKPPDAFHDEGMG